MFELTLTCLFWGSLAFVLAPTVLLPALTMVRAVSIPRPVHSGAVRPGVSLVICAHNEADVIEAKLRNCLQLSYPKAQMEIIVASDGSEDRTVEIAQQFTSQGVIVLDLPRNGKNQTLNSAVAVATQAVLVFTDADSLLEPAALSFLVAPLADSSVGAVGGDYRYRSSDNEEKGERSYWNMDRWLKASQSVSGSMTSATGQLFALRRSLYRLVPEGVTDDFFLSTQAQRAHLRLVFQPLAVSTGPIADPAGEFHRKVRITTRGLNSIRHQRTLLNPFRFGYFSIQLLLHKVLRRFLFLPLSFFFFSAVLLANHGPAHRAVAITLAALGALAMLGLLLTRTSLGRAKIFALPAFFVRWNVAAVLGIANLLSKDRIDRWTARRTSDSILGVQP